MVEVLAGFGVDGAVYEEEFGRDMLFDVFEDVVEVDFAGDVDEEDAEGGDAGKEVAVDEMADVVGKVEEVHGSVFLSGEELLW